MAGGPFAAVIPCDQCRDAVRPAHRIYEGSEDDRYQCPLGHTFGIHWRALPGHPMWPTLDEGELRRTAYRLWTERQASHQPGDADSDWYAAEQEMLRTLFRAQRPPTVKSPPAGS